MRMCLVLVLLACLPGGCASPGGPPACTVAADCTQATEPNRRTMCQEGQCVKACKAYFADCDNDLTNGCEREIGSDPDHCGACATVCPETGHRSRVCTNGQCTPGNCIGAWLDCDGLATNGCEIDGARDPLHCGLCTTSCNGGSCVAGKCNGGPDLGADGG